MELKKYRIQMKDKPEVREITALSKNSAWHKFSRQYFGALRPNRADYTIALVPTETVLDDNGIPRLVNQGE